MRQPKGKDFADRLETEIRSVQALVGRLKTDIQRLERERQQAEARAVALQQLKVAYGLAEPPKPTPFRLGAGGH